MSKLTKRILLGLVGLLLVIQFFRIDKTNPPVNQAKDFIKLSSPPAKVAQLLKDACYDCHSHETKYPWYTNIAPVSWWIKNHIDHGREHLNFSVWADYEAKKRIINLKSVMKRCKQHICHSHPIPGCIQKLDYQMTKEQA